MSLLKSYMLHFIRGGADKSLAQTTSWCCRTESIVSLERGVCLFLGQVASLCLLQRLKGSMSGDARDFNNIETRAVVKFFFPARQGSEGNSHHSDRNIRGTCTIVCHHQNWVAQFKRGDFSTCDVPSPGWPKQWPPRSLLIKFTS